ncbi:MAG TPA: ribonuclease domain-containing protein [Alphaproteobacteria bacterium]|nr:ribonuclease domain-containing protein [Alphaproteobacteria bacterium]
MNYAFRLSCALLLGATLIFGAAQSSFADPSVCGLPQTARGPEDAALADFARAERLGDVAAFVAVVDALEATGRLPACYLAKRQAEARGWHGGADLWATSPGDAIGGDRYGNRNGALPAEFDGRYREADLDYAGGHRGAHRLLYVEDAPGRWLVWVTVDHYRDVARVPVPPAQSR